MTELGVPIRIFPPWETPKARLGMCSRLNKLNERTNKRGGGGGDERPGRKWGLLDVGFTPLRSH